MVNKKISSTSRTKRAQRTSKLKRKNVSKKLKEKKIVRKKSVSKKIVKQKKKIKKRNVKKNKRVNKKRGFFVFPFSGFQDWMKKGMKKVRKEQRHCLRFKKNKGKQSFCFVKALLLEYPWRTMLGFLMVGFVGLVVLVGSLERRSIGNYFGANLQTSLLSSLESKINDIRGQISARQKCIEDNYWTESQSGVCNYWMYTQKNEHCSKFNVPTERIAIGKKMCCEQLDGIFYAGSKQNVVVCPGADIFFNKSAMHSTSIVNSAMECSTNVCQFYPKDGFHVKLGDDGRIIIEKDCPVSQTVGSCDKECGGGKRLRTINTASCIKVEQYELCNVEPCFAETVVN